MKIGIYVRVSTQEQVNEGHSLVEQEERLKAYCTAKGWTVEKVYRDGGFSGGDTNRPALTRMLKDVENKKIEGVIVYKLDRLSRSQKDTLNIIEDTFNKNNVSFISISENFDTSTPFGKAMVGILSVFAQLEREQIKERMTMGLDAKVKKGFYKGGANAPVGYTYNKEGGLEVDKYEAIQVREAYDLLIKGYSVNGIANLFSTKYSMRNGSWKWASTVKHVLRNPVYYGYFKWKGEIYKGHHEPIIDKATFDKAQLRLEEIKKNARKKTAFKSYHLLSGSIWCKGCGARYCVTSYISKNKKKPNQKYSYYNCYSRKKTNKAMIVDPNCQNKNWRVEEIDKMVMGEILKLQFDEEYLKSIINREDKEETVDDKIEVLEKRIEEINKQLERLMDLYTLGTMDIETINNRAKKLNEEKTNIEFELEILYPHGDDKKIMSEETKALLNNAQEILEGDDIEVKRMLVHALIEKVVIGDEGVDIYWNF